MLRNKIIIPEGSTFVLGVSEGGKVTDYFLDPSGKPMKITKEPADFSEIILSAVGGNPNVIDEMIEKFAEVDPVILQHASNRAEFVTAHRFLLAAQAEWEKGFSKNSDEQD